MLFAAPRKTFWDFLKESLLKHYSPADADKIIHFTKQELTAKIREISLDTIEKTAETNLKR
jgi:hypothetical protein